MGKGARITHLHLCCTTNQRFTTTNYVNCDEATFQVVTLSQTNSMNRHDCHVTSIQMLCCHRHLAEAKHASVHAKTKTNFLVHAKCPNQAITHASNTECLCLSHSVIFKSASEYFLGTPVMPRRLCMKAG